MDKIYRTNNCIKKIHIQLDTNLWKRGKRPSGGQRLRKQVYFVVYFTMAWCQDYIALMTDGQNEQNFEESSQGTIPHLPGGTV
jgi:hypothetical protein